MNEQGIRNLCLVSFSPKGRRAVIEWLRSQIVKTRATLKFSAWPRFGLRQMVLFFIIINAQFAAIAYWGFFGAMIPFFVLILAVVAIEAAAEMYHIMGRKWVRLHRLEERVSCLIAPLVLWFTLVCVTTCGAQVCLDQFTMFRLRKQLERDCGFTCATEVVWRADGHESVVVVKTVANGGVFDDHGFTWRDMIVADIPGDDLLRELDASRGQSVTLTVANGPIAVMTKPLEEYPQRQITFVVPLSKAR